MRATATRFAESPNRANFENRGERKGVCEDAFSFSLIKNQPLFLFGLFSLFLFFKGSLIGFFFAIGLAFNEDCLGVVHEPIDQGDHASRIREMSFQSPYPRFVVTIVECF